MKSTELIAEIVEANYQRPGLKTAWLYHLNPYFFRALVSDCMMLAASREYSDVTQPGHVTLWTKPSGDVRQFSLFNATGKTDDTSGDHAKNDGDKRFHAQKEFPILAHFIHNLSTRDLMGVRLNYLGPNSSLAPHKEHIVQGRGRSIVIKARFHLPILTNPDCSVLLGDELFKFQQGNIYFFNNGCVHGAQNGNKTDGRYHLVWDMELSPNCFAAMFEGGLNGLDIRAVKEGQRAINSVGLMKVEKFESYREELPYSEAIKRLGEM